MAPLAAAVRAGSTGRLLAYAAGLAAATTASTASLAYHAPAPAVTLAELQLDTEW